MPPFSFASFSSRKRFNSGEVFCFVLSGIGASAGMFHVFPVKNAPWIFPAAHQLRTVLSGSPCASAYCFTDRYSISIGFIGKFSAVILCKYTKSCRYGQD